MIFLIFVVSFRVHEKLQPRPDWSPLGVEFKISDEHQYLPHNSLQHYQ